MLNRQDFYVSVLVDAIMSLVLTALLLIGLHGLSQGFVPFDGLNFFYLLMLSLGIRGTVALVRYNNRSLIPDS